MDLRSSVALWKSEELLLFQYVIKDIRDVAGVTLQDTFV